MNLLSILQKTDIYNMIYVVVSLLIGLFFGLERSYRGKVNALTTYVLVSLCFSSITIGVSYIHPTVDPVVIVLIFLALVLVNSMIRLWRKENIDDLSSASLLVCGTLSILLPLGHYVFSLFIFILSLLVMSLVYVLNMYVERRKYALTIIVNQEENILIKVLNLCDEIGLKISHFTSSVIFIEGKNSLRLEVVFKYGTPKKKVKIVFDELKEKTQNIIFHGDIHKMEWK